MRILGIDPGSLHCGYALLEDLGGRVPLVREAGVWRLGDGKPLPQRLAFLHDRLQEFLGRNSPDVLAMEESFVQKNVHSALVLGHARGVVMALCAVRGMMVSEYAPASIKQTVAGSGRASKDAVADMVRRQLSLAELPASADATDALAVALSHHLAAKSPLLTIAANQRGKGKGFDMEAYLKRIGRG